MVHRMIMDIKKNVMLACLINLSKSTEKGGGLSEGEKDCKDVKNTGKK